MILFFLLALNVLDKLACIVRRRNGFSRPDDTSVVVTYIEEILREINLVYIY